jgi:hypothetical protein
MTSDDHSHLDAAYVLGALSPAERKEFEQHLDTCVDCARAVREVAGLPGLLSRLDADEVATLGSTPQIPTTVLPALLREAWRARRRRRVLAAVGGLAAAAALAVLTFGLLGQLGGQDPTVATPEPTAQTPAGRTSAMTPVIGQNVLTADLSLKDVSWGTKMSLVCTYRGNPQNDAGLPAYALVVHTRSGSTQQVATWRAVAGKATTIDAATAARSSDITSVEVRTISGLPLLWVSHPPAASS